MSRIVHLGDVCHVAVNIVRGLVSKNYSAVVLISSKVDAYAATDFIKINPFHNCAFLKYVYTILFVVKNRNAIFHCHGMAGAFPFVLGLRYVLHVHGSDIREIRRRNYFSATFYLCLLKRASAVIVATPDLVDNYAELGLDMTKLHFIPNSVDAPKLSPNKRMVDYKGVRLFCPSSNHPIKSKEKLLEAFVRLYVRYGGAIHLTLVNHPGTAELLEKFNLPDGVNNNISVLPIMKHQDLLECYADYDIALDQFGDIKAHGVIAYEACSKGLPVISTIGEKVFENSGIYPGNTPDIIFTSVSDLIDNRLIEEVGLKSYVWVSKKLSISSITERIYSVYTTCLPNTKMDSTLS